MHVVQAEKAETAQCTAHGFVLHSRHSLGSGHAAPPFWGAVSARERDCAPPPHVLVQVLNAESAPTTQSTGHAWLLQSFMSRSTGQEVLPPCWGAMIGRVRDCEPLPHDLLHVV